MGGGGLGVRVLVGAGEGVKVATNAVGVCVAKAIGTGSPLLEKAVRNEYEARIASRRATPHNPNSIFLERVGPVRVLSGLSMFAGFCSEIEPLA